ncbi:unnamed protein product [Bursaphelenchus xylophilus]|uniref:(pine wood nematode) hypothetical protein n=1 Tax=Bursaphelenchus xylophilus TaxID=6326 RepID=A0A1I7RXK7_BURXY|nr:unnamed protein product [Bursaphelenchus xylophilus]CAG9126523.1 unnamed protein product [Bursaphelenchus xylophilus]
MNQRSLNVAKGVFNLVCNDTNRIRMENCMHLTPYRIQQTAFQRQRQEMPWSCTNVESYTFDKSISLEAEFVVVDFVRTRDQGFILNADVEWPCYPDVKRLLVGMSRAKRAQVILASVDDEKARRNPTTTLEILAHHHMWNRHRKLLYVNL